MIKTAFIWGGSYALGSIGGGKIADVAGFKTDGARKGVQIGTGVVAFFILASVLR